jgi:hypothetical protein
MEKLLIQDLGKLTMQELRLVCYTLLGPIKFTVDTSNYKNVRIDIEIKVGEVVFTESVNASPNNTTNNMKQRLENGKDRLLKGVVRYLETGKAVV